MIKKIKNYVEIDPLEPTSRVKMNTKDYVSFGSDNLFPQRIAKLCRESVNHRAILNNKSFYLSGYGLKSDSIDLEDRNNNGNTLHDELKKIMFDEQVFGNPYVEIVWSDNVLFFYHVDSTMCRLSKDYQNIIIHPDWSKYNAYKKEAKVLPIYPNFINEGGLKRSILVKKSYEPEFVNYGLPSWYAGLKSALISGLTNDDNKNQLEQGFRVDGLLVVPGIEDVEDAKKVKEKLDGHKGTDGAGSIIEVFQPNTNTGETASRADFIDFRRKHEGSWLDLHKQSDDDLIRINSWYRTLCGFVDNTGFDTNRILNEYNVALNTIIMPVQNDWVNIIKSVYSDLGRNADDLEFVNKSPLKKETIRLKEWEVRKAKGYDFDPNDKDQQIEHDIEISEL